MIESAGGVIYYLDREEEPKFLLLKRRSKKGNIERIAPKGKMQSGETMAQAAIREVEEETGISWDHLKLRQKLWTVKLRNTDDNPFYMNKNMSFYLMQFSGNPDDIEVVDGEGYVGQYKWFSIQEIQRLIYYPSMRQIFLNAHRLLQKDRAKRHKK